MAQAPSNEVSKSKQINGNAGGYEHVLDAVQGNYCYLKRGNPSCRSSPTCGWKTCSEQHGSSLLAGDIASKGTT